MKTVQEFDTRKTFPTITAVRKALTIADGWAYALDESDAVVIITALQSDTVYNVSPVLFRNREALIEYLWRSV